VSALAAALAHAFPLLRNYQPSPESQKLIAFHTLASHQEKWTERLRQRMAAQAIAAAPNTESPPIHASLNR
jgi:hypothetical protein